jgi:O-succinylbenzoic acid--CoA ligase
MDKSMCPIAERAREMPQAPAIITDEKVFSYKELDELVCRLCAELKYPPGSRIAFVANTSWRTIALLFALFRLKLIACPLSFRSPPDHNQEALARLDATFINAETLSFSSAPLPISDIDPTLPATFLFTSGSTGTPKIACHSLSNYFYSAVAAIPAVKLSSESSWKLSLPLFHVGGLSILFRCFLAGAAVSLSDKHLSSHLSLVPTQLYRQLDQLKHAQCILLGGAPTPSSLSKRALAAGLPIIPTYGMTEMSSLITAGSCVLPHRELTIAADGEILVRGKTLFLGYWEKGKLHLPVDEEGWFATKDLGYFDSTGQLVIQGRKDNLFISGGENIQPEEIENAVLSLPGIIQAAVVPVPDEEFGCRPVLFIEQDLPLYNLERIHFNLKKILPSFKLPIRLFILPKEEGKLRRSKLKEIAAMGCQK